MNFGNRWEEYTLLYWKKIYEKINTTGLFPYTSIFVWGWISYTEYEKSHLYKNNPIQINNRELKVYYYVRRLETRELKFFCFVNTIGLRDMMLHSVSSSSVDDDHLFLRRIYESELSIHTIFDHDYSKDCWKSLKT